MFEMIKYNLGRKKYFTWKLWKVEHLMYMFD